MKLSENFLRKIDAEKRRIRTKAYKKIISLSDKDKLNAKEEIEQEIESLPEFQKAGVIMCYVPLSEEVGTDGLIRKAQESGKIIALPVLLNQEEILPYEYTGQNSLVLSRIGIWEPDKNTAKEVEIDKLDIVIVPGRAFSRDNHRLGRGKGYYDRFLKKIPKRTYKIGIAFKCQVFDAIPFNPLRDEKVDLVISA